MTDRAVAQRQIAEPHVIILNGVSSVGKSSTAKAVQELAGAPFLHVAMDDFLGTLPPRVLGDPNGMIFEQVVEDEHPCIAVRTGDVVERALSGMRRAVAAMATAGNNLVVDEVMWGDEAADYRALLGDCNLRFVGLFAPLKVVEDRERQRGDREIGLARWQHGRIHLNISYDLELDASMLSAVQRAQAICDAFGLNG